jgi:hypothetical protein
MTEHIDIRPRVAWAFAPTDDWLRTLHHRIGFFSMLCAARGIEDTTTQRAWAAVVNHINDATNFAPRTGGAA